MAAANDTHISVMDAIADNVPAGIVLPPRNVREVVEKTAGYIARNGKSFEERLRDNTKLSFILDDDAYWPYYNWRKSEIAAGKTNAFAEGRENEVSFRGREERKGPDKPEDFSFSARMPNISAQDLDVVKLTALFAAKNGRTWMTLLSQREAANYQFDFLRPQHTLYGYFTHLMGQYQDLLNGDSVDEGRPQKKRIAQLEENLNNRFHLLEKAKKRAEYAKYIETQKVAKEEQDEKERVSYAQVDWHDFVVVETVVFDERDEDAPLPAPTTLNDLQSASLEQKAAMRVDSSRRLEEGFPSWNDYDQPPAQQPTPQPAALAVQPPTPQRYVPTPPQPHAYPTPTQPDDDTSRISSLQADRERARQAQEAARTAAPMKIRSDYVPRAQAKRQAQNTSICPNCKQAIPNEEMEQHLRIEMLDPRWREQSKVAAHRSSTTNLSTADVANNLKRLASQRTDVFDPVTGQALSEEEQERRKRAQASAPGQAGAYQAGGAQQGNLNDVQEQIRQLHQKYRS